MIPFTTDFEVTRSLCFELPLLIPCFAVLLYVFQRIFQGTPITGVPPEHFDDDDDVAPPGDVPPNEGTSD